MPNYRKLHVKALESLDINDMPDDFTRLFWVLLPLALDCAGRGLDNAAWLKSKVFPLRCDVEPGAVATAMDWFCDRGMVERYEIDGRAYFWLPTFAAYQGDTSKEARSNYPAPPEQVETNSGVGQEFVASKSAPAATADAAADPATNADPAATATARPGPATKSQNLPAAAAALHALLALPDMDEAVATALVSEHPEPFCLAWAQYATSQGKLTNPAGYCVKGIRSGREPPQARPNGGKKPPPDKFSLAAIRASPYADIIRTGLEGDAE